MGEPKNGGVFMAKIATQKIIWQGEPEIDEEGKVKVHPISGDIDVQRIEIQEGKPVPKTVPRSVVEAWEESGWVKDEPEVETPATQEGPPIGLTPVQGKKGEPK